MGIAILMSVYRGDKPEYFERAMRSISGEQTRKPDQVVLVLDGPVEAELRRVIELVQREIGDSLRLVPLETNQGLGRALDAGLRECNQELVARMDADDIAMPERLERQEQFLNEHSDIDVVGSGAQEIDEAGVEGARRRVPEAHDELLAMLWTNPFIHSSVMFRRERILCAGGYDSNLRRRQDYELWFRAAENGLRFGNIDEPLVKYRFDRNTHKKQPVALAWEQALIGFRGSKRLRLEWWKQIGCFVPFVRALLPGWAQHGLYKALGRIDPRRGR